MRYLGLDLGSRTLGISISDKTGLIASSYKTINHNEEYNRLVNDVVNIVKEEDYSYIDKYDINYKININKAIIEKRDNNE